MALRQNDPNYATRNNPAPQKVSLTQLTSAAPTVAPLSGLAPRLQDLGLLPGGEPLPAPQQPAPNRPLGEWMRDQINLPDLRTLTGPATSAPTPPPAAPQAPSLSSLQMPVGNVGAQTINPALMDPEMIRQLYQQNPEIMASFDQSRQGISDRAGAARQRIGEQFQFGQEQVGRLPGLYQETTDKFTNPLFEQIEGGVGQTLGKYGQQLPSDVMGSLRIAQGANQASRESLVPLLQAGLGERQAAQQARASEIESGMLEEIAGQQRAYMSNLDQLLAQGLISVEQANVAAQNAAAQFNAGAQQAAAVANQQAQQEAARFQRDNVADDRQFGLQQQAFAAEQQDRAFERQQTQQAQQTPQQMYLSAIGEYKPGRKEISPAAGAVYGNDADLRAEVAKNPRTFAAFQDAVSRFQTAGPENFEQIKQDLIKKYPNYGRTISMAMWDAGIRPTLEELYGVG